MKQINKSICRRERERSPEFLRIQEILCDYWLEEPDEQEVRVEMSFLKSNGETQEKRIVWRNRNGGFRRFEN